VYRRERRRQNARMPGDNCGVSGGSRAQDELPEVAVARSLRAEVRHPGCSLKLGLREEVKSTHPN
jgi:hypothetical protein